MATFTFTTVGSHSWTSNANQTVTIKMWGAAGGDGGTRDSGYPPGSGGNGGYAELELSVSDGETLELSVAGSGDDGEGSSYDGTGSGGSGGSGYVPKRKSTDDYTEGAAGGNTFDGGGAGGGGGGSSIVWNGADDVVARAHGGGGGSGAYSSGNSTTETGGGGGGGLGGAGGLDKNDSDSTEYSGSDASALIGSGGGNGADAPNTEYADGVDGEGGTVFINKGTSITETKGGGNSGNATIEISYPEAPSTPQNLTVDSTTDTTMELSWDEVDWNGDVGSYEVYRASSSGSTIDDYQRIESSIASDSDGTVNYVADYISNGRKRYFRVLAKNSEGDSSLSNEASGITNLPAPSDLTSSVSGDDISLSWTDNSDEYGFRIYRKYDGGSYTQAADLAANTTSYTDSGLLDGEKYTHYVQGYTDYRTANSGTVSTTTNLPAPSDLSATVDTVNYDEFVDLSWVNNYTITDATTNVLRSTTSGTSSADYTVLTNQSNGVDSYTDNSVAEDNTYYFRVEAVTTDASALSGEVSVYTDLIGVIGETTDSAVRKSTDTGVSRTDESK